MSLTHKQRWWIRLRRDDPTEFRRRTALKSIRRWRRNLAAAKAGIGFFKEDHCLTMIALHVQRFLQVD